MWAIKNVQKKEHFGFIVTEQLDQAAARESPDLIPSIPFPPPPALHLDIQIWVLEIHQRHKQCKDFQE